jgi:K+-sensing histidine kinase KdpD
METAKMMGASVTVLYIRTPGETIREGQDALRIYNEVAKGYGVEVKLLYKEGDILGNILDAVESESASLVMMGTNEETMFGRITKSSISQELLRHTSVPTTVLPIKALEKKKEEDERRKRLLEEEFNEDKVAFDSLNALEKIEEESMDFDEE